MRRRSWILPSVLLVSAVSPGACGDGPARPDTGRTDPPPDAVVEWLADQAVPLAGSTPDGDLSDLEPLRAIIGDARVVALGEATHGTREFQRVKHRIFRFLVERMGFDTFVLEASWPEAQLVDAWLADGDGDPRVLLSRLYRWFWNTREEMDLVEWMRDRNRNLDSAERLRFGGMDVQYPLLAMDTVLAFLDRADPEAADSARARYHCFLPYVNSADGSFENFYGYTDLPTAMKNECRRRAEAVHEDLSESRGVYLQMEPAAAVDRAIQSARVVVQNQHIRLTSEADQDTRDMYLAENALWVLERAGPNARAVFSMHDFHVAEEEEPWPSTAHYLRTGLGSDLVLIGFAAYGGTFNAYDPDEGRVGPHPLEAPGAGSYEEAFHEVGLPLFLVDLRELASAPEEVRSWMDGPRSFRSVGFYYQEGQSYAYAARLPREFDALLYLDESTPTTLLPFVFPPEGGG